MIRLFLCLLAAAATAAVALSAQQPEFDLLIRNGTVIDPQNGINAVMDVAIAGSKIASVGSNIAPARARQIVDAKGLYVTPGLIDIHAHVFWGHDEESQYSDGYSAVQPDSHSFRCRADHARRRRRRRMEKLPEVQRAGDRSLADARARFPQHRRFGHERWARRAESRRHGRQAHGDASSPASRPHRWSQGRALQRAGMGSGDTRGGSRPRGERASDGRFRRLHTAAFARRPA